MAFKPGLQAGFSTKPRQRTQTITIRPGKGGTTTVDTRRIVRTGGGSRLLESGETAKAEDLIVEKRISQPGQPSTKTTTTFKTVQPKPLRDVSAAETLRVLRSNPTTAQLRNIATITRSSQAFDVEKALAGSTIFVRPKEGGGEKKNVSTIKNDTFSIDPLDIPVPKFSSILISNKALTDNQISRAIADSQKLQSFKESIRRRGQKEIGKKTFNFAESVAVETKDFFKPLGKGLLKISVPGITLDAIQRRQRKKLKVPQKDKLIYDPDVQTALISGAAAAAIAFPPTATIATAAFTGAAIGSAVNFARDPSISRGVETVVLTTPVFPIKQIRGLSRTLGRERLQREIVFDPEVLKGTVVFPEQKGGAASQLKEFRKTVKTPSGDTLVQTSTAKDFSIPTRVAKAARPSETGLFVTPTGRGSPNFLRIGTGEAARKQLSILPDFSSPSIIRIAVSKVERLPKKARKTGIENVRTVLADELLAGSRKAFISPAVEAGRKIELEAIIPEGTLLNPRSVKKKQFTDFGGTELFRIKDRIIRVGQIRIPIEDVVTVGGSKKIRVNKKGTKTVKDIRKISAELERSLTSERTVLGRSFKSVRSRRSRLPDFSRGISVTPNKSVRRSVAAVSSFSFSRTHSSIIPKSVTSLSEIDFSKSFRNIEVSEPRRIERSIKVFVPPTIKIPPHPPATELPKRKKKFKKKRGNGKKTKEKFKGKVTPSLLGEAFNIKFTVPQIPGIGVRPIKVPKIRSR